MIGCQKKTLRSYKNEVIFLKIDFKFKLFVSLDIESESVSAISFAPSLSVKINQQKTTFPFDRTTFFSHAV